MAARRSRRRPNKWHGIAPFLAPGDVVEPHREGDRYGVTVRRDGQTWCTVLYSLGTAGEVTSVEFRPEVPPDVVLNIDPLVEVARLVDLTEKHVRKWVQRFVNERLPGLRDRPGRGRKPVFSPRGRDACGDDRLRTTG